MRLSFVIDHSRCIGCHACSLACKAEHDVPLGSYRTWVKYVEKGAFPDVRRFFTVLRCNHCDDAPCITICPVTALFRRSNGIVDFDRDACIGCKACMQACPYDALYIHPDRGTAEKCNFCAHRVEQEMEPPCATVCPTESIVVGDLDDPASRVSRLIATRQVSVRKPEKGTRPKVFYIQGEPSALTPGIADPSGGYLWADHRGTPALDYPTMRYTPDPGPGGSQAAGAGMPESDGAGNGGSAQAAATASASAAPRPHTGAPGTDAFRAGAPPAQWLTADIPPAAAAQAAAAAALRADAEFFTGAWAALAPPRSVYDVAHEEAPWGWKVSAYLWTKSIAAGAFIIAALAPWLHAGGTLATAGTPLIGLLFLALTGMLLVADLKKPARFWTILTRPNWRSWLARGAFIIAAFGALAALWGGALLAVWFGSHRALGALVWLRWPVVATALATAGYSGYLFAQAKGRDFWQSPLLPLHLCVQALAAGAAVVVLLLSHSAEHSHRLPSLLAAALAAHLGMIAFGEVSVAHATRDGARAAHAMVRGRHARLFWAGILLTVIALACAALAQPVGPPAVLGALAALAGLAFYEHAWNLAGQAPPLS
jgi:Fe-S-cluster-containing dehydrogenase component/formate-dependent nitrite reductase membrane component NrfD